MTTPRGKRRCAHAKVVVKTRPRFSVVCAKCGMPWHELERPAPAKRGRPK